MNHLTLPLVLLSTLGWALADEAWATPHRVVTFDRPPAGISGSAWGDGGELYAIAERERRLVVFAERDGEWKVVRTLPVVGIPSGLDTESLAYLGKGRFAVGTESLDPRRSSDRIFWLQVKHDRAVIEGGVELPYRLWNLSARPNKGIEGLCAAGPYLVAALEQSEEVNGARYAPLAVARLEAPEEWTPHRVRLTSKTGKISGLHCTPSHDGVQVLALERHYGTCQVLRWAMPPLKTGLWEPTVVLTPFSLLGERRDVERRPNFEAVVQDDSGRMILLSDNHTRGKVDAPTMLLEVPRVQAER